MSHRFALIGVLLTVATAAAAPVPKIAPDPLPKGATARLGSGLYRGPGTSGSTFSADGKRLLAFHGSGLNREHKRKLVVWDVDSGKVLTNRTVAPPGLDAYPSVNAVVANDRIVWLCEDPRPDRAASEVVVADPTGSVLNRFDIGGRPIFLPSHSGFGFNFCAVSPDARHLAVAFDEGDSFAVYELATGRRVLFEEAGAKAEAHLRFGQDRATLFVRRVGKPIRRYAIPAGKLLPELEGTDGQEWDAVASPGGKWVVTSADRVARRVNGKTEWTNSTHAEVRDGSTGRLVGRLEIGAFARYMTFAGPETLLIAADKARPPATSDNTHALWNVATRTRLWKTEGPLAAPPAVSPDGKFFATGGASVRIRHVATGKLVAGPDGHTGAVGWVSFSPDGKTVYTAGGEEVIAWSAAGAMKQRTAVPELRGSQLYHPAGVVTSDSLSWTKYGNDAKPAALAFGWNTEKAAIAWRIPVEGVGIDQFVSPDGRHVVRLGRGGNPKGDVVTLYDGKAGTEVRRWVCEPPARAPGCDTVGPVVSGDGRYVLVGGDAIVLLDALTGKEEARIKQAAPPPKDNAPHRTVLAASADGSTVAVFDRHALDIYDVKSAERLARHEFAGQSPPLMRFSPDGRKLAVCAGVSGLSTESPTVRVWDRAAPQQPPRALTAEADAEVRCAAFSPNNATLAVGYADGTALLWDLTAK